MANLSVRTKTQFEVVLPKMGESITEATIINWEKEIGDTIAEDETLVEIATDKVDSEVPCPVDGRVIEILYQKDDVVPIGSVIAIIETASEGSEEIATSTPTVETKQIPNKETATSPESGLKNKGFYSPLVRNMAKTENISDANLATIPGTGHEGRVTKKDILAYIANRTIVKATPPKIVQKVIEKISVQSTPKTTSVSGNIEIMEMSRMRKLIAKRMLESKQTSPHVTSFVEVDVTDMVNWRNSIKVDFQKKYGEKITFTPLFIEAVAKAIQDFPMINVSVDGDHIILKKDINIGIAVALPSGNLIVPVIKNADQLNLLGLTKSVNGLVQKARNNKLKPDDIQDGTFTLTNVGTFGNDAGTPIINQPQVAILATGAIRKKPAVVETKYGDVIAIRQMMMMSLSYDHRVVDGYLGGSFLRRAGDYLEQFKPTMDF